MVPSAQKRNPSGERIVRDGGFGASRSGLAARRIHLLIPEHLLRNFIASLDDDRDPISEQTHRSRRE